MPAPLSMRSTRWSRLPTPLPSACKIADVIRKHDILRLKGFAAVTGKRVRLIRQAVGASVDTCFDPPLAKILRQNRLVGIGQTGLDRATITAALAT